MSLSSLKCNISNSLLTGKLYVVVAMANSMGILQSIKGSNCLGLTNSALGCVLQGTRSVVLRANVSLGSQESYSQGSIAKTHQNVLWERDGILLSL